MVRYCAAGAFGLLAYGYLQQVPGIALAGLVPSTHAFIYGEALLSTLCGYGLVTVVVLTVRRLPNPSGRTGLSRARATPS
jgi:hypothetical protein